MKLVASISRESVHFENNSLQQYRTAMNTTVYPTRLIVTRDPFSRLLSSYIDKIYLPDFWQTQTSIWLKYSNYFYSKPENDFLSKHFNIMKVLFNETLPAITEISTSKDRCGKYMTFSAFVENSIYRNELHWSSIHEICNPCIFKVSHVSKMETFSEDARVILSKMKENHLMDEMDKNEQVNEEIRSVSKYNFNHFYNDKGFVQSCVSYTEIAYRLWYSFRWRGYIDPKVEYVIPEFKSKTQVEEDFMSQVWAARKSGLQNPKDMANAKNEFWLAAYRSISKSLFEKLVKKYELDFKLFGYTDVRDELFSLY